ncbi:DNA-binding MarR family transcriptional regulator [Arthrobacter stackebrandtii]|uniref:DNA-binding MarR family transcriptional regulator n=1 Tax=Arthrobacter stackebrandtii TaxID=272161 RepID=A0ABS4Z002_9MICC|nr:DNA-binding MarR family transcriptional regulator [Arthrobacter stackebrandtii]PYH00608.1 MarR family transcriptional regulator [Arthrobacter stackebrandtii]
MSGLNEVIHAPNRLRICAFLSTVDQAEFGVIRDMLGVADSVASKQLKVLEDAGYVALAKPTGRGRVKTWASLTPAGRAAYREHVAALQALIAAE